LKQVNQIEAMKKHKTSDGFTLLEILIAIFIFSIIATTIFGSFSAVFSSADSINEGIDDYEMGKNCLSRMLLDLQSVYIILGPEYVKPTAGTDSKPGLYRMVGDTSNGFPRLRFTSRAHVFSEKDLREGIAEVVYYVQMTKEEHYVLRRADSLYPYERYDGKVFEEKFTDPALCEKIRSLEFKYYDAEETEYDYWDSESEEFKYSTPRAIRIKLEFGEESSVLAFETMVAFQAYREKVE